MKLLRLEQMVPDVVQDVRVVFNVPITEVDLFEILIKEAFVKLLKTRYMDWLIKYEKINQLSTFSS